MAALTDFAEKAFIDHFLRGVSQTSPATVYLALFTTNPLDAATGTEAAWAAYGRQLSTWSDPGVDGITTNTNQIIFPANNSGAPVIISYGAVFSAVTAGNMIIHGAVLPNKTLAVTDSLVFEIGDLSFTIG